MLSISVAAAALAVGAAPARAGAAAQDGGWTPVAIPPFDAPAGVLCDFPVHYDAIVNRARTKVVQTYPDGSPKRELATGALFLRVANATTGRSAVVDTSDSAVTEHGTDGSRVIHTVGPVIALVRAGTSNLPRGIYAIDGITRVELTAAGFKTITLVHASIHEVCPDLA
ncbi:hypothetical protein [Dactylosporangium matsuzakiense]|uniref:Secreted protein n=1 Tax=Dactylosporangium matsuzakiense TaxID=53360 RepID=A0A9W6NPT8_9ACTN|nr:hypothetical protein [Dactylosporangium matsuzakiense]UWZ40952.1 hypothetical protein Dmats_24810 [Dactylosporangium matsuzakiense]GLL04844.1 hypothetical protein GCM10017581_065910 [Dactylosporangium matsuzakiense]